MEREEEMEREDGEDGEIKIKMGKIEIRGIRKV